MNSLQFSAPEYYHRHKTADWYWTVGIIAVAAAVTAIILNNVLLAILIVLAAFSLSMHAARPPKDLEITISNVGVTVGKYQYLYSNLESFWLEHHGRPRLLIKTKRVIMPHIIVPVQHLSENDKEQVRELLRNKIAEEEQTPPLLEQIVEHVGF